ncbi:phage tail tape measure protein [Shewanella algae]|uniref:phage tail tape measure protein n=1 Tax=Shewanella algae TaxID=38313 RepID=UPI001183AAF9|nr:phage tail tape measure protein [Shewanella algae]TVL14760.1 hypothetical protein AYJ02_11890 [Shewanella algae]
MSLPQPLMFTVGLIDQITKPIAKISHAFNGLAADYQRGTMQMASGIGGIAASALGIHQALMPAIEMDRALGNAKGIGLTDDALNKLADTSMSFAIKYGKSATEVIGHGEKMRQIMGEMPTHVLQSTTESSAVLAMVMKSDADTVSKYLKNLYGNNEAMANAMGRDKFIAQVTGMTAKVKQLFGTEMGELEGMIDGMHSLTSTLQVPLKEQFAVLGMLSKQMGQGDAVTQYTNFLENIQSAQGKLGVTLTDSTGKLLPMVQILERLKPLLAGKSQAGAWQLLDEAGLGDGSLAIINMINNLDSFKASMVSMESVKGLGPAIEMAAAMTDQTERLTQSWYVVRAAFGSAILPAVNGFMGKIADMGKDVIWFTKMFPNLTKLMGYTALAVAGLVAAFGALTVVVGIFNILASPIVLVTAAVIGLVAAIGFGIAYADELRSMLSGTGWGDGLLAFIDDISAILGGLKDDWFGAFEPMMELLHNMEPALEIFGKLWLEGAATYLSFVGQMLTWIIGLFADFIGMSMKFSEVVFSTVNDVIGWFKGDSESTSSAPAMPTVDAIAPTKSNIPRGGLIQQMSNASSKTTNFGDVIINNADSANDFINYVEMRS